MICPFEKAISHDFYGHDMYIFIAEIKSMDNKKQGHF